ncbi:hypothetical protein N9A28_07770 [Sulfurimonas sp.]|nr:hypothetical protein [Sulfurimonas sp.]
MKKLLLTLSLVFLSIMFSGAWSGQSAKEERQKKFQEKKKRLQENQETLKMLYKYAPESRNMLLRSYAYATFTNFNIYLFLVSAEGGHGVAHNNRTGKNTYMNMASGGIGLGLGVKNFRGVFLFKDKRVFDNFINKGWEANIQADAAAKFGNDGGAVNAAMTIAPGVRLYKITENGLALDATIQGTKYWKDEDLN